MQTDPFLAAYLARPVLLPYLQRVWDMFWRLSRRRPVGFALGAIPFTEFHAYCATFQIMDVAEREWLCVRLDALDAEYLDLMSKKADAAKEQK